MTSGFGHGSGAGRTASRGRLLNEHDCDHTIPQHHCRRGKQALALDISYGVRQAIAAR